MSNKTILNKRKRFKQRKARVRAKISGTSTRPRLAVYRSLKYIYVQLIDDTTGTTLVAATDKKDAVTGTKSERAKAVGLEVAKQAKEKGITEVLFDRGGRDYRGRVKALAEGAREGGLQF